MAELYSRVFLLPRLLLVPDAFVLPSQSSRGRVCETPLDSDLHVLSGSVEVLPLSPGCSASRLHRTRTACTSMCGRLPQITDSGGRQRIKLSIEPVRGKSV
jgi:hypothetical protein